MSDVIDKALITRIETVVHDYKRLLDQAEDAVHGMFDRLFRKHREITRVKIHLEPDEQCGGGLCFLELRVCVEEGRSFTAQEPGTRLTPDRYTRLHNKPPEPDEETIWPEYVSRDLVTLVDEIWWRYFVTGAHDLAARVFKGATDWVIFPSRAVPVGADKGVEEEEEEVE